MAGSVLSNSATAGTGTESTNQLSKTCRRLWVRCDSGSAASVRVRVQNEAENDNIHDDAEYRVLAAGEEQVYDASIDNKISALYVWTASGTGTFSFEVTGS